MYSVFISELNYSIYKSKIYNKYTTKATTKMLTNTCYRVIPKWSPGKYTSRSKYWWIEKIVQLRKDYVATRRRSTRSRGNQSLKEEYKQTKEHLKKVTRKNKESCWKDLITEVENDPWELPCKIVGKKFKTSMNIMRLNSKSWVSDMFIYLLLPHNTQESIQC